MLPPVTPPTTCFTRQFAEWEGTFVPTQLCPVGHFVQLSTKKENLVVY